MQHSQPCQHHFRLSGWYCLDISKNLHLFQKAKILTEMFFTVENIFFKLFSGKFDGLFSSQVRYICTSFDSPVCQFTLDFRRPKKVVVAKGDY